MYLSLSIWFAAKTIMILPCKSAEIVANFSAPIYKLPIDNIAQTASWLGSESNNLRLINSIMRDKVIKQDKDQIEQLYKVLDQNPIDLKAFDEITSRLISQQSILLNNELPSILMKIRGLSTSESIKISLLISLQIFNHPEIYPLRPESDLTYHLPHDAYQNH